MDPEELRDNERHPQHVLAVLGRLKSFLHLAKRLDDLGFDLGRNLLRRRPPKLDRDSWKRVVVARKAVGL